MAVRKGGLGRGLDALLGGAAKPTPAEVELVAEGDASVGTEQSGALALQSLPVDLIGRSPYQPRTEFDPERLQELADSIQAQGVIQPVVVRPLRDGRYELIAGERRWRAAQLAGLHDIPVVVRDVPDQAAMAMALIENIQREDLGAVDEAQALQRLHKDFELTHQEVADAVGRSRAAVSNMIRLLDLQPEVLALLSAGDLDMGHGRALLALEGTLQVEAATTVAGRGLSVRETEKLVQRLRRQPETVSINLPEIDPDVRRLQQDLTDKLGCPVTIQVGRGGSGKLVVEYTTLEELDGLLEHIH
ncbi:MAG TPA: ParB/RepB/Spo0J family partition protein [Chromatiaceae bacterium]|nr:ParB/RepB/Spo0J family partition protein [Chromatiaceae bacterium]HIA08282.1 ParB/RepB/Spo0J family partition protein [Chromatiaceae bacterium]HIN82931.1 ParB/RepB/Spo0J family partition protein [Chromatiales bacterium]HIO53934.1 ParB/RepB/Spo0J family partition protein [Chromatiales bacterium]